MLHIIMDRGDAMMCQTIFDVTSTSTHKVRFAMGTQQGNSNTVRSGSGTSLRTSVVFLRLGDT